MKKLTVLLALSLLVFAGTTYAAPNDPAVPESVNSEFTQHFTRAKDVKWEYSDKFFKATFDFKGKVLFAFYSENAEFIGVATNVLSNRLPVNLSSEIKKSYAGYWITDLFRYKNADENGFVITLENPDKVVILKSEADREWNVYHVTAKK